MFPGRGGALFNGMEWNRTRSHDCSDLFWLHHWATPLGYTNFKVGAARTQHVTRAHFHMIENRVDT